MGKLRIVLVGGAVVLGLGTLVVGGGIAYALTAFPDAGPVKDFSIESSPEVLARGEYLAEHVMGCEGCHSGREMTHHGHPVQEGTVGQGGGAFGGGGLRLYAKNITPAGVGSWSDAELFHAVTTGVTPDGRALFPLMPWMGYAQASEEDLNAVLAWVRSLEPIENAVPERSLPGPLPVIVNFMPQPANNPEKGPDPSDELAYGEYLVTIASCADCHTPKDDTGNNLPGMELAGGMKFTLPEESPDYGIVRSANITPDKETGIGSWTREQFIGRFKAAADDPRNGQPVEPGHTWSMMPWPEYAGMTEQDLGAMYAYLQSVPAVKNEVVRFELAEGVEARGWPAPKPTPEGMPSRGALGSLCDTVATDGLDAAGLLAEEPDAELLTAAKTRATHRGFAEYEVLAAGLAERPVEERRPWLAEAAKHHGLNARCEAVLAAKPPADGAVASED